MRRHPPRAVETAAGKARSPPARTRRPGRVRRPTHPRVRYRFDPGCAVSPRRENDVILRERTSTIVGCSTGCARPKDLLSAIVGASSKQRSGPTVLPARSFGRRQSSSQQQSSRRRLPEWRGQGSGLVDGSRAADSRFLSRRQSHCKRLRSVRRLLRNDSPGRATFIPPGACSAERLSG